MNYDDMVFSNDDKARLKENRNAICKWIMENIVPNIADDDTLKIDFGGIYKCPRSGTPVEKYHLRVWGKPYSFYFMGNRGSGNIGFAKQFGVYESFEKAGAYDVYPVVDNWKMIKRELLNQIEERKVAKGSIYAFEV